jgi:hypothetical protein
MNPNINTTRRRVSRAKLAYTTRRAPQSEFVELLEYRAPRAGDWVLARVEEIGQHKRLELRDGRRATLFPGDEIVVCYGTRYAPDQFEARVPGDLAPCDLVAAGGIAAEVLHRHANMEEATRIAPIGLLATGTGRPANLREFGLSVAPRVLRRPPTLAVAGSAMNAGKTTAAANLIRGLAGRGLRVGAAKVTGTGAGGDVWLMKDAGADPVLDFTDAGFSSTYCVRPPEVERILFTLSDHLAAAGAEVIVLEAADGMFQDETVALLGSRSFRAQVDGVVFAARDALGAAAGVTALRDMRLPAVAVSGVLTGSPLAMREAHRATGLPVLDVEALRDPVRAGALLGQHERALAV